MDPHLRGPEGAGMKAFVARDEEIFTAVLALQPDERNAYLDRACQGDTQLEARVRSLLEGFDAATRFVKEAPKIDPLEQVDRYRLMQELGEGGCGTVYLAEQT